MSELVSLLEQLVRIDSVNPELVAGGAGEAETARFVAAWLERAGLDVELYEVAPGRPNVVAVARGTGDGRSLLLNAHTDTVGVAGMERPHEPAVRDGRLYGRGSYDMKAGLAAAMHAAAGARAAGLRGDVVLTAVVDEELASLGTESVVERVRADAAIVTEPTDLRLAVAHKGFVGFELETTGCAAHGSRPDLGIDAIARMGHVLVGIERLDKSLRAGAGHPLLGTGSLHASLIEGGQEFSSYPARCVVSGERRTIPGETVDAVEQELRGLAGDAAVRLLIHREPLELGGDEPIVELVSRHAGGPEVVGMPFWTDAALLAAAGIPALLYGPAGEGAHAEVEWVDLESLERCARVLGAVAAEFCA